MKRIVAWIVRALKNAENPFTWPPTRRPRWVEVWQVDGEDTPVCSVQFVGYAAGVAAARELARRFGQGRYRVTTAEGRDLADFTVKDEPAPAVRGHLKGPR